MKHFTALDFQQQATDEGFTYFNCIMANGLELQITPLDWGWQVGVYDIDGRLIAKENQPFLVGFSGIQQLQLSHKAMLSRISDLYDKAIRRKVIPVKSG